ncbi:MAG: hypothetical protein H7829_01840 [Magnetococcus sp. THC-1_WYH]
MFGESGNMVRHLVKVVSLLLIFIAYPSAAHAFVHQCKSVGVTFDEFRVKKVPRDGDSFLCYISASIRLINCTNKPKRMYSIIQGVDSKDFSLFKSELGFNFGRSNGYQLDSYSHKKVSDPILLDCNMLKKIKTWKVEVGAY